LEKAGPYLENRTRHFAAGFRLDFYRIRSNKAAIKSTARPAV